MKVFLIDANALIYRIYHALPRLEDLQGRPIQVVYGLANILLKLLQEKKADYIFALYDRPEPSLRHQVFKEYKATRPKITDDLKSQLPLTKKVFSVFRIPVIEKIGYEADDLIATLKEKFSSKAEEIIIFTGDLDTLQLVDEKTKVLTMKKGITQMNLYDLSKVKEKFSLFPNQIPDYKALVGDASDNIPGIKGIGPKGATKLLKEFFNLEGIIKSAQEKKLERELNQKILENKEKILFYRDLVTLRTNLEIEEENLKPYQGFDQKELLSFFQEFGFRSLIKRLQVNSLTLIRVSEEKPVTLEELKPPFFFYLDKDRIKVVDESGEIKILPQEKLKTLLTLKGEKFTFALKDIFKKIFLEDFYFDKKINLDEFFDLKIIFWLLYPNKGNYSLEEIILYLNPNTQNSLSSAFLTAKKLLEKLKEENLEKVYFEIELPLIPILTRTELRGIKINLQTLNNFKEKLKRIAEETLEEIYKLVGEKFNPNSPKQLRRILFEKLKIKTKGLNKTDKGEISTKETELEKIIGVHPVIEKILNYRKINKLLTTYTDSLLKTYDPHTGRIYTIFNQTGTVTGRLVSENPNLQNLPLESDLAQMLRKIFISEENFVFVSGDYSQIELRLLAHLSQDENLISAFLKDLDIHSQTAKMIFGEDTPETRRRAKIINFSIAYGTTVKGLAERMRFSLSEANKLTEKFFYFYPGVKKFKEEMINFAKTYSYVETLFGRKRFIPEINSQSYRERTFAERVAINMPLQGLAADLLKKAMIVIDKEIYEKNLQNKAFFVLSIHDEIIFEAAQEIKEEFKFIIKEKMENIYKLRVPLKVKIKEGTTLGDLK